MANPMFRTTKAENIKVSDVWMQVDEEKRKSIYYYYRAKSVFIGEKAEAIYNLENEYIGTRKTNCVEVLWMPLSYEGKPFIQQYHPLAIIDVSSDEIDINNLIQEENQEEEI